MKKDLIFFDLETTGVNVNSDRIVQIAAIKIKTDGSREEKNTLVNPEIPIPKEASDVHGITDDIVKNSATFKQLSVSLREWFKDCDLAGYNSNNFDIPLLSTELYRSGLSGIDWNPNLLDVFTLYRHIYPNTLSDVYKRLTNKKLENAHDALSDVRATEEIASILIEKVENADIKNIDLMLQGDKLRVDLAGKLYKSEDGIVRYSFGKDAGKSVKDEPGFGRWMLNQDFPFETKEIIKKIIN